MVTLVLAIPNLALSVNALVRPVIETLYVVLPRFGSVGTTLVPGLASGGAGLPGAAQPDSPGLVASLTPLLTSLLFGAACYGGAFALFNRRDY